MRQRRRLVNLQAHHLANMENGARLATQLRAKAKTGCINISAARYSWRMSLASRGC
jgi:hypothetical protein